MEATLSDTKKIVFGNRENDIYTFNEESQKLNNETLNIDSNYGISCSYVYGAPYVYGIFFKKCKINNVDSIELPGGLYEDSNHYIITADYFKKQEEQIIELSNTIKELNNRVKTLEYKLSSQ